MEDFITLTCPTCGGKLQITPDLERFACSHCGNEHIVKRGGGVVSIAPIVEGLKEVRLGVDKTASELAITRLRQDLQVLDYQYAVLQEELQGLEQFSSIFNNNRKAEIREALKDIEKIARERLEELEKHQKIVSS